jgi:non-ribosomal peptide synthetase component F
MRRLAVQNLKREPLNRRFHACLPLATNFEFGPDTAFNQAYRRSIDEPEKFWGEAAEAIDWFKKPELILDNKCGPRARWFVGGELNTCYNAVDRHVEAGRGEQVAVIYDSPLTDSLRKITYKELQTQAAQMASALANRGITKGDGVVIYMPMIPEAIVAMLACQVSHYNYCHACMPGGPLQLRWLN